MPFPFAVDDHQTGNAKFLSQAGGAVLLPQKDLSAESISLIRNYTREQLLQMAEKARDLARPDATLAVAQICEDLIK